MLKYFRVDFGKRAWLLDLMELISYFVILPFSPMAFASRCVTFQLDDFWILGSIFDATAIKVVGFISS